MELKTSKDIKKLVIKISEQINEEILNELWPGFNITRFALYKDNKGYLSSNTSDKTIVEEVLWSNKHYGNTCIKYKNEYLGIWDLNTISDGSSFEKLYASIVHELFHGYQNIFYAKNYAYELTAVTYDFTKDSIALMLTERECLYHAVMESNTIKKQQYLTDFINIRNYRKKQNPNDVHYDLSIECNEGTATYVEYKALKYISNYSKEQIAKQFWNKLYQPLNLTNHFRRGFYATGFFICLLLDDIAPNWKTEFQNGEVLLFDLLYKHHQVANAEIPKADYILAEQVMAEYKQKQNKEYNKFHNKQGFTICIKGNISLKGYDPMNLVAKDKSILHKHFLMFKAGKSDVVLKTMVICDFSDNIYAPYQIRFKHTEKPIVKDDFIELADIAKVKGNMTKVNDVYEITVL